MELWTWHRRGFDVQNVLKIDHTLSQWWNHEESGPRYRELIPRLCKALGTKNFVWCDGLRGMSPGDRNLDDWELNVPKTSVLKYYRADIWDSLLHRHTDDFSGLLLEVGSVPLSHDVGAFVQIPLPPGTAINRGPQEHGRIINPRPRSNR
jgi:hypothetical protein